MRTAIAPRRATSARLLLLLVVGVAFLFEAWSLVAIVGAFTVGMFAAQRAQILVRRRRVAAAPVAIVPGGLDHVSGSRRRQRVTPAELPPPPGLLQGRGREIDEMWRYLSEPGRKSGPKIILVHGDPGVGKTALAVRMAHLVADDYPDGQLLLRFDSAETTAVEDRLALFVNALKGPRDDLPERADLLDWYREHTQRRRVLVILDNVGQASQIEQLLPVGHRCLVIVTSRNEVPGLAPRLPMRLAPLADADATALLDTLVGAGRVVAEPEHAALIVAAAAGYPVALHMAGAVLAVRKNWTLEIAVRRMTAVASEPPPGTHIPFLGILDLAFALLTHDERRVLVLLSLVDARRVEPWMVAALFNGAFPDRPVEQAIAGRLLDRLARAHFTDRRMDDSPGLLTYRVPVYVHDYADIQLARSLTATQRQRAALKLSGERRSRGEQSSEDFLRGTVFHFLDAGRLDEALNTARQSLALCREQAAARPGVDRVPPVAAEEGPTLAALAEVHAELGWIDDAMTWAEAARQRGEHSPRTLPRALRVSGNLRVRLHQVAHAEQDLTEALQAVGRIDDDLEHIRVLRELIALQALRCDLPQANGYASLARARCERAGLAGSRQLPAVLLACGKVWQACGNPAKAGEILADAERRTGDPESRQHLWRPWIRLQRALTLIDLGEYGQSREFGLAALEGFTALRHRYGGAHARLAIGRAHLAEESLSKATPLLEESHGTFLRCGDRWMEADSATALADAYHRAGRGQEAIRLLSAAEQAFIKLTDPGGMRRAGHLLWKVESYLPVEPEPDRTSIQAWIMAATRRTASGLPRAVS